MADLLQRCYVGTVDFDLGRDFQAELVTWRTTDHADDGASRAALLDAELVGLCLVGHELGSPLVYEVAVAPQWRRRGLGSRLLASSLATLAEQDAEMVVAWVTVANFASEALLGSAGFVPVGQPISAAAGIAHYRAAVASQWLDVSGATALATEVPADGKPLLWVIDDGAADTVQVAASGTDVTVVRIAADDVRVAHVARTALPIAGAAWLLARKG